MREHKWVRSSLRHLSRQLTQAGHAACPTTLSRLLRKADYSLQANRKREAGAEHPDRNRQFEYLTAQKQAFLSAGQPVISVDTKKKELIGNFKNVGRTWCREPLHVLMHDFPQDALGRAVPYGIYDLAHNQGFVRIGNSADTPEFAVDAITAWWQAEGSPLYPHASRLLILADAGGSNGCRPRAWKQHLQEQLSNRFGLAVTVCHYPTGCSKYNPIEYRLFSPIRVNWAGQPLRTFESMAAWVRGTTTKTGLRVKAVLEDKVYQSGQRVSNDIMKSLRVRLHAVCPRWNYTLEPRPAETGSKPEVVHGR